MWARRLKGPYAPHLPTLYRMQKSLTVLQSRLGEKPIIDRLAVPPQFTRGNVGFVEFVYFDVIEKVAALLVNTVKLEGDLMWTQNIQLDDRGSRIYTPELNTGR